MKAIAIVDLPDDALEWGDGEWIIDDMGAIRYSEDNAWVHYKDIKYFPLKPVPERKEMTDIVLKGHTGELLEARYDGFNACLQEILGEEE